MNERRDRGGHGLLPFLLIPATVMAVKAMHRHRVMRAHGWGPGAFGPGSGHHAWGGPADGAGAESRPEFRLPPKIEAFLSAWHDQAHKAAADPAQPSESNEGPAA